MNISKKEINLRKEVLKHRFRVREWNWEKMELVNFTDLPERACLWDDDPDKLFQCARTGKYYPLKDMYPSSEILALYNQKLYGFFVCREVSEQEYYRRENYLDDVASKLKQIRGERSKTPNKAPTRLEKVLAGLLVVFGLWKALEVLKTLITAIIELISKGV